MTETKIIPKTRTIYNNYRLWELEEDARENLKENGVDNPTEEEVWQEIYFQNEINWDEKRGNLIAFFNDEDALWILQGSIGSWDGRHRGGYIFTDFMEMFYKATKDCEYVHIYDENGHLFLDCSHHDGRNSYEIKKITQKGIDYLHRWEENWSDKRTEEQIHDAIMERYSTLPHFAHKMYGCPKREYQRED